MVEIELPILVASESNQSRYEHWGSKVRRFNYQKRIILQVCRQLVSPLKPDQTAVITLTRIAFGKLDRGNIEGAFKAVQDVIASKRFPSLLQVDDADPRLEWIYDQEKPIINNPTGKFSKEFVNKPGLLADGTGLRIKIEVNP